MPTRAQKLYRNSIAIPESKPKGPDLADIRMLNLPEPPKDFAPWRMKWDMDDEAGSVRDSKG